MMTNVTAQRDTKKSEMIEAAAIARLEEYEPASADPDQVWPPPVTCQSWDNQTLPHAIHYAREDIRQVFSIVCDHALAEGQILITDFRNGLPCLLWERLFPKVVSILSHRLPGHEPLVSGNQTVLFGKPADTVFLYQAMEHLLNLKVLLIDDLYYGNIISLYFIFRKVIRAPGAVIFLNSANRVPEHAGMQKFLNDLGRGTLDNVRHKLVHLHKDPKGYGVSYELIS